MRQNVRGSMFSSAFSSAPLRVGGIIQPCRLRSTTGLPAEASPDLARGCAIPDCATLSAASLVAFHFIRDEDDAALQRLSEEDEHVAHGRANHWKGSQGLGVPDDWPAGHGNWSMIDAFDGPMSKLPLIQALHQQSAVHIADAHYRVTGQPIAASLRSAPGATNTGDWARHRPLRFDGALLITASAATHMRGHGVMQELDRVASPDFPHVAAATTKRHFRC